MCGPVVVGDFNEWDQHCDPFVEELDGRRYVTVSVPADTVACFRYLADTGENGGEFYDDPAADRLEPNGFGQTHSVLDKSLRSDAVHRNHDDSQIAPRKASPKVSV